MNIGQGDRLVRWNIDTWGDFPTWPEHVGGAIRAGNCLATSSFFPGGILSAYGAGDGGG